MSSQNIKVSVGLIFSAHYFKDINTNINSSSNTQINKLLIAKRHAKQHQGDLWEFPGGKIEVNETAFMALRRECREELGIEINSAEFFTQVKHDYGDKLIELLFWRVLDFTGEAYGREQQVIQWVTVDELANFAFPEANRVIISKL